MNKTTNILPQLIILNFIILDNKNYIHISVASTETDFHGDVPGNNVYWPKYAVSPNNSWNSFSKFNGK